MVPEQPPSLVTSKNGGPSCTSDMSLMSSPGGSVIRTPFPIASSQSKDCLVDDPTTTFILQKAGREQLGFVG